MAPSALLALAPELINEIYDLVLVQQDPIRMRLQHRKLRMILPRHALALTQTCQKFRREALPLFLQDNVFQLHALRGGVDIRHSLDQWLTTFPMPVNLEILVCIDYELLPFDYTQTRELITKLLRLCNKYGLCPQAHVELVTAEELPLRRGQEPLMSQPISLASAARFKKVAIAVRGLPCVELQRNLKHETEKQIEVANASFQGYKLKTVVQMMKRHQQSVASLIALLEEST